MRKKFEEWEKIFIYLTYIDFTYKEIAKHLGVSTHTISNYRHKHFPKKNKVYIGQRFGKLEVIDEHGVNPRRGQLWLCRCDCGRQTIVLACNLVSGNTTSCRCKDDVPETVGFITGQWFNKIKKNAIKNGKRFNLDMHFLNQLWIKQNGKCAISGLPVFISEKSGAKWSTASLDRIDSSKCYTEENVQIVHVDVNFIKREFEQNYFISLCKHISKNNQDIDENKYLFQNTQKKHRKRKLGN